MGDLEPGRTRPSRLGPARADPALAELVRRRLQVVLGAAPHDAPESVRGDDPGPAEGATSPPPLPPAAPGGAGRGFGRAHLAAVAVVLVAAALVGGWMLLRARPVVETVVGTGLSAASPLATGPASPAPTRPPGSAASPAAETVVHVVGAVRRPGLVRLPGRARVQDAIDAAGGLRDSADPGDLNLAQPLADGQQVVIGTRRSPAGEVRDQTGGGPAPSGGGTVAGPAAGGGEPLDLNRASVAQFDQALPGVGPVTAQKIVDWREQHGRFSRVEELQEVDGIGPKTYADIAPYVRV